MKLSAGSSGWFGFPANTARVQAGNPDIVEVEPVAPTVFRLHAKSKGSATITVFTSEGARILYTVTVE